MESLDDRRAAHDVGVGLDRRLHLGVDKVDHRVVLEDVHLLDARDVVHADALERVLQTLIVGVVRSGVLRLLLPADGACGNESKNSSVACSARGGGGGPR